MLLSSVFSVFVPVVLAFSAWAYNDHVDVLAIVVAGGTADAWQEHGDEQD